MPRLPLLGLNTLALQSVFQNPWPSFKLHVRRVGCRWGFTCLMGNLHLSHLCDVTLFHLGDLMHPPSRFSSSSSWQLLTQSLEDWAFLLPHLISFYFFSVFILCFKISISTMVRCSVEGRWNDDDIVSLLVWLAAMMAQTVLALSDHLLRLTSQSDFIKRNAANPSILWRVLIIL